MLWVLCDMNQKILIGALSSCQLGSLFMALDYIEENPWFSSICQNYFEVSVETYYSEF